MKLTPRGVNEWRWFGLRWGLLILFLVLGLLYLTDMPGKSYSGPLHPLDEQEFVLRDRLRVHVNRLARQIGERNVWRYPALEAAANYIHDYFRELGYQPDRQTFRSQDKMVQNLAVEIVGSNLPEQVILVGAHYDSVLGSPGANDNGSGVAAVLELARLFKDRQTRRSLRFVTFVNEEPPFSYTREMGSRVYASRAREQGEQITAMLSLETIGYYSDLPGSQHYPYPFGLFYPDKADFIGFVGNLSSRRLVHRSLDAFRRSTKFPSEGLAAPSWMTGIGWSDHWSFWQAGYPAIMVTDTALFRYKHYHAPTDMPDKLDYDSTARVVMGLGHVIQLLANEQ
ncbi:MAG: M28 family peptidase [Gammaproteobacteria bacterium]|nr:M28 family peptidase [Gammaproteobacteria bacterium]